MILSDNWIYFLLRIKKTNGKYKYILDKLITLISTKIVDLDNEKEYKIYRNKLLECIDIIKNMLQNSDNEGDICLLKEILEPDNKI